MASTGKTSSKRQERRVTGPRRCSEFRSPGTHACRPVRYTTTPAPNNFNRSKPLRYVSNTPGSHSSQVQGARALVEGSRRAGRSRGARARARGARIRGFSWIAFWKGGGAAYVEAPGTSHHYSLDRTNWRKEGREGGRNSKAAEAEPLGHAA